MLFLENVEILVNICEKEEKLIIKVPTKAYNDSAGYDLFSDESLPILPWSRALVNSGIRLLIPKGYYGEICHRSGVAVKNGILAFNGTVDLGYSGIVFVLLFNLSDKTYIVSKGDRIAQIIFKKCLNVSFSIGEIKIDSDRGVKGFGSSGV